MVAFTVPETAATDLEEAATTIHGDATIDDQPGRRPRTTPPSRRRHRSSSTCRRTSSSPASGASASRRAACGEAEPIDCFSAEYWRDLVLAGSDTAVAVISAIPVVGDADPLSIEAMERGKALAAELCGDGRVLIQGHAVPDVGPLDAAARGDGRRRRGPRAVRVEGVHPRPERLVPRRPRSVADRRSAGRSSRRPATPASR